MIRFTSTHAITFLCLTHLGIGVDGSSEDVMRRKERRDVNARGVLVAGGGPTGRGFGVEADDTGCEAVIRDVESDRDSDSGGSYEACSSLASGRYVK